MNGDRVPIRKLLSGVPGLDEVLGGGIPEFSFNLIAGGPGSGKTTLGHQILFTNAAPARKALYISVLGEPPLKMLRYQQQYSFFDADKVAESVRFVHIDDETLARGLPGVLETIIRGVDALSPGIVIIDSLRAVLRRASPESPGRPEVQDFMQSLANYLTSCQVTTFALGEYAESEKELGGSAFTVSDGILWLSQSVERNSVVRKLQIVKMRGQGQIPGLHTVRITDDGVCVFPRLLGPENAPATSGTVRVSTGVLALDEMMGGGIPQGYSVLLAGPSGSGKTVLSSQFIADGVKRGERGVVAVFERRPNDYLQTSPLGRAFQRMVDERQLEILYLRPLDLSIDEALQALRDAVMRIGAKRAVIDSLSGFELALAPTFREDFRESLYRMMGSLTSLGVTVMATVELADSYSDLRFSPQGISFLTDAIIMQRYVEVDGELRRALSVVKVRGSQHSKDLREYQITQDGLILSDARLHGYDGLLSGHPSRRADGKILD